MTDHQNGQGEESASADDQMARAVLKSAIDFAILTTDLSLTITNWNSGAEAIFGWTRAQALGADLQMIFIEEDRQRRVHRLEAERAATDGRSEDERWHIRADGTPFWASGLTMLLQDERTGEHIGYLKIVRDNTERHLADSHALMLAAQFRALVEASPQMTFFADDSGRITYANRYWHVFTGRDSDSALQLDWTRSMHPEDRSKALDAWNQVRAAGVGCELEIRFLRAADQSWRWFLVRAAPIDIDGGHYGWLIIASDIDLSVAARNDMSRKQLRLMEEVAQRKAERDRTWRLASDLMIVTDLDGEILDANPAWTRQLGWHGEELLGSNFVQLVHPDYLALAQAQLGRLHRGQASSRFICEIRHKDGSYRTLSWTAVPGDGLIHAVAQDLTAENAAAAELEQAQEALRQSQKMEALGQLTGGIAHDFNNLLMGIQGSLQLMQKRAEKGMEIDVARYTGIAMESARRAAALTHRLLAFARRQPLAPKKTHADVLIASLSEMLERTLGERITLTTSLEPDLWATLCDPHQLESAILNLAINARDAMPEGGSLVVSASNAVLDDMDAARSATVTPGEYVRIAVSDTGVGMTADIASRAVEPFFTTKPQGQGTGLGLSMVYGFVRQSKGYTEIHSVPEEGTLVELYLPRFNGDWQEDGEEASIPAPAPSMGEDPVVLIVEDDPRVRDLLAEILRDLHCQVIEAIDGPSGLRLLRDDPSIDLVVSDVGLPGLNGRQMVDAARVARPELKVILMTGYAESAALADDVLGPRMELMTKPFGIEDMSARVATMLRR